MTEARKKYPPSLRPSTARQAAPPSVEAATYPTHPRTQAAPHPGPYPSYPGSHITVEVIYALLRRTQRIS